jgi:glucosyl-3-phosphoglycerate synthase
MTDFHQHGIITTLHPLHEAIPHDSYVNELQSRLASHARSQHITLLLPCLYSELANRSVIDNIVATIRTTSYISSVVIALGGADREEFIDAHQYFSALLSSSRDVKLVWVDGPAIQSIMAEIEKLDIRTGDPGKGQSVWISLGYILGCNQADVIALHDCDIVTYDSVLLARLIEPVADPNKDFEFCKGYYARISPSERAMKGRVTRLFVAPFVDEMKTLMREQGYHELESFFSYHHSYNYPLSGEFCMSRSLARAVNIAYDWALEVSTLSQVYELLNPHKIAQVDLARNYEHKHQAMSIDNEHAGLHRMVIDIAKFYLNYMRSHGYSLNDATVDMLLHSYYQNALAFVKRYSDDASINCLQYDRYQEERAVEFFRGYLWTAWEQSRGTQLTPRLPSWNRVLYSIPGVSGALIRAVLTDNQDAEQVWRSRHDAGSS